MYFAKTFLQIIIAGIMSGSFTIPAKFVKNFSYSTIWLYHTGLGFVLVPWLIIFVSYQNLIPKYLSLPENIKTSLALGGVIFGLGQICLAFAINIIGIATAFIINIGVGLIIGSMYVLYHNGILFSARGEQIIFAVFLVLGGMLLSYFIDRRSEKAENINFYKGYLLALIAGCASGLQNVTFIYNLERLPYENAFFIWPPFLLAASLPMLAGFGFIQWKAKNNVISKGDFCVKDLFLVLLMALIFDFALMLYGNGMNGLNKSEQGLGWPILMIFIILSSQFWGHFFDEKKHLARYYLKGISTLMFVVAFIVLVIYSAA